MKEKLVLLGAGGHARSVLDILLSQKEYDVVGCVADSSDGSRFVPGMSTVPILGSDAILGDLYAAGIRRIFVALGNNRLRAERFAFVRRMGFQPVNVISTHAHISNTVYLGTGICVMPGAVLNVNTTVGDNTIINTRCSVDHDCVIGSSVHLAPGTTLSGTVRVGDGTQVGTGACVIDGITIGEWSLIGAGSAVVRNIESHIVAYGVPAKKIRDYK